MDWPDTMEVDSSNNNKNLLFSTSTRPIYKKNMIVPEEPPPQKPHYYHALIQKMFDYVTKEKKTREVCTSKVKAVAKRT